jgi:nucleoside-diphosphate-sugar epimerase
MRILLTGASSMTGYWFARRLAEAGHQVLATFTLANAQAYGDSLRARRVKLALERVEPVFNCRFGDDAFLDTITRQQIDVLCHHGAQVADYRSPDFNAVEALANNTRHIVPVLRALLANGTGKLVLTSTVFAGREGAGSEGLPHFSPYGLSKTLTSDVFEYYCRREGLSFGKFVVSNPFGPYEEPRFTAYLVRSWRSGEIPTVKTPDYVRDNIHVTLLAAAYRRFVEDLAAAPAVTKYGPSGYVESQGAFAQRFAREMQPRLGFPCPVQLAVQTEFSEPLVRINTDPASAADLNWNEAVAWDELAEYYSSPATAEN